VTELHGAALRLTVVLGESDQWHHHPTYSEIVHRAHAAGLAGVSVFRGIEGYGRANHLHTARILSLSDDLPVSVVVVDSEEKVRAFLSELEELLSGGIAMVEPVEVVRYV
jgi:PII-like signaling protein